MIKCAAIKRGELVYSIARPARHHDIIHAVARDSNAPFPFGGSTQGFLTESGDFVDREAAFKLTGKGRHGKTYSEDLW
jgi:hypothetical protein